MSVASLRSILLLLGSPLVLIGLGPADGAQPDSAPSTIVELNGSSAYVEVARVRIWNRALTADEIASLYQRDQGTLFYASWSMTPGPLPGEECAEPRN
jgi:hypothetical protein